MLGQSKRTLSKSSQTNIKQVQQLRQPLTDSELESLQGGESRLTGNGSVIWGIRSAGGVKTPVGWIRTPGTEIAGAIVGDMFPDSHA